MLINGVIALSSLQSLSQWSSWALAERVGFHQWCKFLPASSTFPGQLITPISGIFFFTGPLLLLLATIFEWIMGNFFPMMAFGALTVFWASFGLLQLPTLGLATPFNSAAGAADGALSKEYNAAIALYLLVWGFALFTFLILSTKTNLGLTSIFVFVTTGTFLLSGAYWKVSTGDYGTAKILQKVNIIYGIGKRVLTYSSRLAAL
jgi:succinate-acetate transporter protein